MIFSFDYVIKEMVNVTAVQHGVMDALGRFAKHSRELELHSATLTLLSCIATSRVHP